MAFAVLSGVLLGLAFPPADLKWLAWVGLVPLLWALERCERPRRALLLGYIAGFLFFLITVHPLVSAHAWTGWAIETQTQFAARMSRQWWFLQIVWVVFSAWGASFWGIWAWVLRRVAAGATARFLVLAPSLWILVPEGLRAQTTFGFTWALLGNATADHVAIRQLAALGGVWLLSALVVLVNAQAMSLLQMARTRHRRWGAIGLSLGCVGLAVSYGMFMDLAPRAPRKDAREPVPVAAIQHTRATYHLEDFLPIGLDRRYPHAIQEALAQRTQLIVLPESIALGAMRLDATHSPSKPPDRQTTRSAWDRELQAILRGTAAVVVIGLDTVEAGHDHNTLVAWTREGSIGWYHKQGLVPFSEYVPSGWNLMAIRGRSQYSPGHGSQLIRLNEGLVLGGFICQEVLLPGFVRRSVRDGATVLVSGGNDGVFANPAVARVHADAAQLRAVETGRFLVRAMKTGISAVIDPRGRELVRSQSAEPALLLSAITPLDNLTPYVRFGDWVLWLAALLAGGALLFSPLPPAKRK